MKALWMYYRFMTTSIKAQMQYRASILLQIAGMFMVTGIEFFGLYGLFDRFGSVKGWQLEEVALFYGFINIVFAFADAFSRGFDTLSQHIRTGTFDRFLLRPLSTALQLFGYEFTLRRAGRLLQGTAIFVWGWIKCSPDISGALVIAYALPCGIALFCGIIIVSGFISFWTVESLEMMNVFTYGGVQTGLYPLTVYKKALQYFFIFCVPIGMVSYFPICAVLQRNPLPGIPYWVGYISPVAGIIFLGAALLLWKIGVRHYTSTGS